VREHAEADCATLGVLLLVYEAADAYEQMVRVTRTLRLDSPIMLVRGSRLCAMQAITG
jgi:hypothetical protein